MIPTRRLALLAIGILAAGSVAASGGLDQDEARRAVDGGEIRPLDRVLAAVRAAVPGEVLALKLKRRHDRLLYEVKVLNAAGKRREVTIDARTLAILDEDEDD